MKEIERLSGKTAGMETDNTLELATKKHSVGELARFFDEILDLRRSKEKNYS